jgi:hypothetical protein
MEVQENAVDSDDEDRSREDRTRVGQSMGGNWGMGMGQSLRIVVIHLQWDEPAK